MDTNSNPYLNEISFYEFYTLGDTIERRSGAFILLHEEIFHSRFLFMFKDSFEINDPISDFCKTLIRFFRHIFYMPEWKSAGMFLKHGKGILPRFLYPV